MDSILTYVKKMLGVTEEYEHFDVDIISHINSVFATLNQLGVGPSEGFTIEDKQPVWDDFISTDHWFSPWLQTYVFAKVKLAFDPPPNSTYMESLKETIAESEWRIRTAVEDEGKRSCSDFISLEKIEAMWNETFKD